MGSGGLSLHTPSGPSETTQIMALGDLSESHQPPSLPGAEARPPIKHSTLPLKTQGKQVRRKEGGREGGGCPPPSHPVAQAQKGPFPAWQPTIPASTLPHSLHSATHFHLKSHTHI